MRWLDGRPVINASVHCKSTTLVPNQIVRDFVSRYVGFNGRAIWEVLADEDFRVEADGLTWKSSGGPILPLTARPSFAIPAGTGTVHLSFVIDIINDISAREAPENMAAFNDQDDE